MMIADPSSRVALSCLGWVDRGSLWQFESASGRQSSIALSDADFLRLFAGDREHFVVQHNWGAKRFTVAVHAWSRPGVAVSSIEVAGWVPRVEGDLAMWASLPVAYVGVLDDDATGAAGYFVLTVRDGEPC